MVTSDDARFASDLKRGKSKEMLICGIINKKYPQARVIDGYCKGGDILIPEINAMVEVKFDEMSIKTGNWFFETEYDGEPSGIKTTQSDWWAMVDDKLLVFIRPDAVCEIVRCRHIRESNISKLSVKGYIVPKPIINYSIYAKVIPIVKNYQPC